MPMPSAIFLACSSLRPSEGVDEIGVDLLGGVVRHFLDVHAAFAGDDEGERLVARSVTADT